MATVGLLRCRETFPLFCSVGQGPISHPSFAAMPSPHVLVKSISHYIPLLKKATKVQQWGKGKHETFSGSLHHFLCLTDTLLPILTFHLQAWKSFLSLEIYERIPKVFLVVCFVLFSSSLLMAILIDSSMWILLGKFHFLTGCHKCFTSTTNKVVLHKIAQKNSYAWCSFCISHS